MSDASIKSAPPVYRDLNTAQFVYFDIAPCYGVMQGAIQIELAARVMVPDGMRSI